MRTMGCALRENWGKDKVIIYIYNIEAAKTKTPGLMRVKSTKPLNPTLPVIRNNTIVCSGENKSFTHLLNIP